MSEPAGEFCVYEGPVVKDGMPYGGPINLKTKQGFAIVTFPTPELARWFIEAFKLTGSLARTVIPLSELGSAAYPRHPSPKMPRATRKIVFPSQDVVLRWAAARESFDTAPYVFNL
jgi:hypothetical protein